MERRELRAALSGDRVRRRLRVARRRGDATLDAHGVERRGELCGDLALREEQRLDACRERDAPRLVRRKRRLQRLGLRDEKAAVFLPQERCAVHGAAQRGVLAAQRVNRRCERGALVGERLQALVNVARRAALRDGLQLLCLRRERRGVLRGESLSVRNRREFLIVRHG